MQALMLVFFPAAAPRIWQQQPVQASETKTPAVLVTALEHRLMHVGALGKCKRKPSTRGATCSRLHLLAGLGCWAADVVQRVAKGVLPHEHQGWRAAVCLVIMWLPLHALWQRSMC